MMAEKILARKLDDYKVGDADLMFSRAAKLGLGVSTQSEVVIKRAKV